MDHEDGNPIPATDRRRFRFPWRVLLILALIVAPTVVRYLATRAQADRNAVRTYTLETSATQDRAFTGTLRLGAFNIAHGRGTNASNWSDDAERALRLKAIADLLKQQRVDVVVLNEVDFDATWTDRENQAATIAREAGYAHVMEQRNFDVLLPFYRLRFGNAILSRFPIASAEFVNFPPRSPNEHQFAGSKQGSFADIRLDATNTIRVFAVHLEWRDEATRGLSGQILSRCASNSPVPFFCIGDFNCSPAFAHSGPGPHEASALDTLLKMGCLQSIPPAALTSDQLTFSSFKPVAAIDWILIPRGWEFVSHEVLPVQLSDHRPVIAEVRLSGEASR